MAKVYDGIHPEMAEWIARQPVFFVATAPLAVDGLVNLSPKGTLGTFRVVDERTFAYLDIFGSGVETETICSSMIAEAFAKVKFPILPVPVRQKPRTPGEKLKQQLLWRPTRRAYSGLLRARHPTLCVPRDFDLSPYFDIIKFSAREGASFDYRKLEWEGEGS